MTPAVIDRARAWVAVSDARLLLVVALGLYVVFALAGPLQGYGLNGVVDSLRRLTFLTALYAILVLALNLQWGYTGMFNIGVAGFMAVGVYTMAILSTAPTSSPPGLGLPIAVGIIGGVLAAALLGVVVSVPALRLRGDYLAIVTLAAGEIVRLTYRSPFFQDFTVSPFTLSLPVVGDVFTYAGFRFGTGGPQGITLPENPLRGLFYRNPESVTAEPNAIGEALFGLGQGLGLQDTVVFGWVYALVLLVVVALVYWLLVRVGNSPFGRVLKAIREDEIVAGALGKDTRWFKIKVFALGCGLMGLAAILWRLPGGYTSTSSYLPIQTFYVFVALIIGGAGSNTGSVIGAAAFTALLFQGPLMVRRIVGNIHDFGTAPQTVIDAFLALGSLDVSPLLAYTFTDVNISALRLVLLGVVLIVLIQRRPDGLLGHRKEIASSIDLSRRDGGDR